MPVLWVPLLGHPVAGPADLDELLDVDTRLGKIDKRIDIVCIDIWIS